MRYLIDRLKRGKSGWTFAERSHCMYVATSSSGYDHSITMREQRWLIEHGLIMTNSCSAYALYSYYRDDYPSMDERHENAEMVIGEALKYYRKQKKA